MRCLVGLMLIAFGAGGLGLLAAAARDVALRFRRRPYLERAEGVVVSVQRKTSSPSGTDRLRTVVTHFPVVRFSPRGGDPVVFTSEIGDAGDRSRYAPGQPVAVRYDREGVLSPVIDSWGGLWLPPLFTALGGLAFLGGAWLIYVAFGASLFEG